MQSELPKQYDPATIEGPITERWLENKAFGARPDERENRYVIMMPLPNVTGALHMGHAMDNVMQDLLIRWHRMRGDNTLWMPGTDHAGIATQAVVERRLKDLEGKTRHDIGREALVERIWAWKDEYQQRIIRQQQAMGCSCDWDRQRFTMDDICARAVRYTFFSMFKDGLIYKGNRLVNWDCELETAVADDEVFKKTVQGNFWHLRYPVIDPKAGEPTHVVVATTRPETMLGDTAVACHPDPSRAINKLIAEAEQQARDASAKDKPDAEKALESLRTRKETHLAQLETIAAMARDDRHVMLPLQERPIPIICDEWAKPELGSGCVKVTPAHDPNDYEVWKRHTDEIGIINLLQGNGTLNENAGAYKGQDRFDARKNVVADLEAKGLIENVEDREVEVDHSDRSKTIIEPYLSVQWFVRMGDVDGGIVLGRGTPNEFTAPGLAQAAMDGARPDWQTKTGRHLTFYPDSERYGNYYTNWLAEKRDWCISRQLWWGHRIPVWTGTWTVAQLKSMEVLLTQNHGRDDVFGWILLPDERRMTPEQALEFFQDGDQGIEQIEFQICFRDKNTEDSIAPMLSSVGLTPDPDVLDTWFSSSLWPQSTLGWPDPESTKIDEGQSPTASQDGRPNTLEYYYPGSCLVTGRDIITLWVVRMMLMGLYNLGDVPFTDCFIHASIQDGKGNRMSKSAGNGIDPVDIIEKYGADAMRFVICDLQTGTQDVRLPVHAISPFTGNTIDLATAKHGQSIFTYLCPETGKEFDILGTMAGHDIPPAKLFSDRFEVGRAFSNKLWNSARFVLMNLGEIGFVPLQDSDLQFEDRWILSRLARAIGAVHAQLELYNPSAAIGAAREFFWNDFCDWYVEMVKPRLRNEATATTAGQALATVLDQILRLFHPFVPFITEAIWEKLNEQAPKRGIDRELPITDLLVQAAWPECRDDWKDDALEAQFVSVQEVVRKIREVRQSYDVPPSQGVEVQIKSTDAIREILEPCGELISFIANATPVTFGADSKPDMAATAVVGDMEIFVLGVIDVAKEIAKLEKQQGKVEGQIKGKKAKLENPGFLNKAPAEVVQAEKDSLTQLESELQSITNSLADLRD